MIDAPHENEIMLPSIMLGSIIFYLAVCVFPQPDVPRLSFSAIGNFAEMTSTFFSTTKAHSCCFNW